MDGQIGEIWPPPSTAHAPVYEFQLKKAMLRSRVLWIPIYQPVFWKCVMEVDEHGLTGLRSVNSISNLPWSDIVSVTFARKRSQVCIVYVRAAFGFRYEVALIFPQSHEGFDLLGVALKRFAKEKVIEDETIYWSYSKLMVGYSLFWLFELSVLLHNHTISHWAIFWKNMLRLIVHFLSPTLR